METDCKDLSGKIRQKPEQEPRSTMPMSAVIGSIYRYTGSLLSLHSGQALSVNLLTALGGAVSATFVDDDGQLNQASDGIATVSFNGGAAMPIDYIGAGSASLLAILGIKLGSRPAMAFIAGGNVYLHFPQGPPPLNAVNISFSIDPATPFNLPNPVPICLTAGTPVLTPRGPVPAEQLRPGDLVMTRDHGAQPLLWVGQRAVSLAEQRAEPRLRPVRIAAGALGNAIPHRRLLVSQQHRVLVQFPFPAAPPAEALVPARLLLDQPGIGLAAPRQGLVYLHLLFDRHEIIFAEGCAVESLYLGAQALRSLAVHQRLELRHLLVGLPNGDRIATRPARRFLTRRDLRLATVALLQGPQLTDCLR